MPNKLTVTYRKAFANKPVLDAILTDVATATGARPISNMKNPQTASTKVKEKQRENPSRDYELEDVNDIARARLVYGSLKELYRGVTALKTDIEKYKGIKLDKADDFFKHPEDGYTGYHVDITFPNGQTSEIQLHTVNSYAATLATHPLHATADHEEMTPDQRARNKAINDKVNSLNPHAAVAIATILEAQNAPQQVQSQVQAIRTALGVQPPQNALQSQGGGIQQ